jgi:2,4-dienoyl-CoA reductase-like NADH-dependent reductase (Old Yellow Enzyme family)
MNTSVKQQHSALRPIDIGELELQNRLVVAPMSRVSAAPDGTPTAEMVDYYSEFADGGFAFVITEGTYTDTTHSQGYLNQPGLAFGGHVDGWRRITEAVHATRTPIVAQLCTPGRCRRATRTAPRQSRHQRDVRSGRC